MTLHPGDGVGPVLVLDEALSLWGAVDRTTGEIKQPRHPQHGQSIAGRVLVMSSGRGSSSTSSVLAEMIRSGVAPAAIVLQQPDGILIVGAIIASELYGISMPIVVIPDGDLAGLRTASPVYVHATEGEAAIATGTAVGGGGG